MRTGLIAAAALIAAPVLADDIRTETVKFESGTSGAKITDQITGYESVLYRLGASAGQQMAVRLTATNASTYFNLYVPGKGPGDEAMFIGAITGNTFEGTLPASGDYGISVFLYRNAARREETSDFTLEISIDGPLSEAAPATTTGIDNPDFYAAGSVLCVASRDAANEQCALGIKPTDIGSATVLLQYPNGNQRYIYFDNSVATSSDSDGPLTFERDGDMMLINIGEEHYELPAHVVLGG